MEKFIWRLVCFERLAISVLSALIFLNTNAALGRSPVITLKIPITVKSSPAISSPYTDVVIHPNGSRPATLPDYAQTATATDNGSGKIAFTKLPAQVTVLTPGVPVF